MKSSKAITKVFNIAIFSYFLFNSALSYLFDPIKDERVPWDRIYDWSPVFAIGGALVILLISVLLGAVITRVYWNRFIADVFKVREITFDESLAIVLIIAIISA